jgi:hypothetical protein
LPRVGDLPGGVPGTDALPGVGDLPGGVPGTGALPVGEPGVGDGRAIVCSACKYDCVVAVRLEACQRSTAAER